MMIKIDSKCVWRTPVYVGTGNLADDTVMGPAGAILICGRIFFVRPVISIGGRRTSARAQLGEKCTLKWRENPFWLRILMMLAREITNNNGPLQVMEARALQFPELTGSLTPQRPEDESSLFDLRRKLWSAPPSSTMKPVSSMAKRPGTPLSPIKGRLSTSAPLLTSRLLWTLPKHSVEVADGQGKASSEGGDATRFVEGVSEGGLGRGQ